MNNARNNEAAASQTANIPNIDVHNEPPTLNELIANAEDYVRTLCSGYKLSDEDVYDIWASTREYLTEFLVFGDKNLTAFKAEFDRRTVPWVQVKHLQSKYADVVEKTVRHTLHKSTLPYDAGDLESVTAIAWGFLVQWISHGEATTLIRGVSLTRGLRFESVKHCSKLGCQIFCRCKDEELSLQRWLVKFAKSAGESWRTERRVRNQDEDNARAKARSHGFEVAPKSKDDQVKVWYLDSVSPRCDQRFSSTSDKPVAYDDAPDVEDYYDEACINRDTFVDADEHGGTDFSDYATHNHTGGYEQCEKSTKIKGGLQGTDVRGISANPGARFNHNRNEKPNAEIEAALEAWRFRPVVRRATQEEWERWQNNVVDFQPQASQDTDDYREHDVLTGYLEETYRETGQFLLGDLPTKGEPDFHEVDRKLGADRWYHRHLGRVKIVRRLKDGEKVWVEIKGERHLVDVCDLKTEPWTKERKPRKSKKNAAEASLVAA